MRDFSQIGTSAIDCNELGDDRRPPNACARERRRSLPIDATDGDMRRLLPDYSKDGQAEKYGPGWLERYRNAWDQLRAASNSLDG